MSNSLRKKINLLALIFVLLSLGLIIFLPNNHLDVDIFYHYKFAYLLKNDFSLLNHFDWWSYAITNFYPADLSYGYHLLFTPFTLISPPLLAIKFFSAFLLLILLGSFAYAFNQLKLTNLGIWLLVLIFGSSLFLYRLTLSRPFILSIAFTLLLIPQIIKKKYSLVFLISLAWAFFYVGFPLAIFIALFFSFCQLIVKKSFDWQLPAFSILGVLIGLSIRSDFPQNLLMIFHQLISTLRIKYLGLDLNIGIENSPLTLNGFIDTSVAFFALLIIQIFLIIYLLKKIKDKTVTLNLLFLSSLSYLFFLMTLFNLRFIEYFIPLTILATASTLKIFNQILQSQWFTVFLNDLKTKLKYPLLKITLIIALASLIFIPINTIYSDFQRAYPLNHYQQTAEWLKNNTPEKSIIFHTNWDTFPRLFFYNDHNYYLVGLDPTFMYLYDKNLYWLWRNITEQSIACDLPEINKCSAKLKEPRAIAQAIKMRFNSEYIWVNEYCIYKDFKKFLGSHPEYFEKKIETNDSAVFKIINH